MNFQAQYQLLLWMIAVGMFLGAMFEVYRQCHKVFKFRTLLLHFLDVCYWLMAAFLVFMVLYQKADGELRLYSLVFLALGAIIHYVLFKNWTIKGTNLIIKIVTALINSGKWVLYHFFYRPLMAVWRLVRWLWQIVLKLWKLILVVITTLVGFVAGVVHWTIQRVRKLLKLKK